MTVEKIKSKSEAKDVTCGIVMPISSIDGCPSEHWSEVKNIITEAVQSIAEPRFTVKLVSDADDVGVIQKRIVQNIYSSDIIVCDVSGKNPNVMFELGMRLAFDKPTVIIKDDKTDYSFDTGVIEHVPYPRDLRFSRIVTFKTALSEKVLATHRTALTNPDHSTFLKSFGKFQIANLAEDVVPADKLAFEMLSDVQSEMSRMRRIIQREMSPKNRSERDTEATVRIMAAIDGYRTEKAAKSVRPLMGREDFYTEIERRTDAPRYFDTPDQFREVVDQVLREYIRYNEGGD